MKISVVVVTWNGLHHLRPCVVALEAQSLPHELIIVDNGSSDHTVDWVRQTVPDAHLVPLPQNLGFAGGNNAGIAAATGDVLVLINNDTLPPPDFLKDLTEPLLVHDDVGVTAAVLTFAHRQDLIASAGIVPGHDGVHRDAHLLEPVASLPSTPVEIFAASGGGLAVRRRALDEVGLFADRFFNYLEDADLGWRLRLHGWRTMLTPQARLPHVYSATSGHGSPFKHRLLTLNRWRVILRCMPSPILRCHALSIARYDLLALVHGLAARQGDAVAARFELLGELPQLRRERRAITARAQVSVADLESWLVPAPSIGAVLHQGRALDRILRERPVREVDAGT